MKIIKILLLLVIFIVPIAGFIFTPNDLVLKGENRNITPFPKIGKPLFFVNLQNYIVDRIFFKVKVEEEFFPFLKDYFSFFKFEKSEISIEGKNGWLFFSDRASDVYRQHTFPIVDSHRGKSVYEIEIPFIIELSKFSKAPLYMIVGPDKHGVYHEFMDPYYGKPGQYRLFSKFKHIFENNGISVIDPYDALIDAKKNLKDKTLYYTDDTHWNLAGSKVAFDYVMNNIVDNYKSYKYSFSFSKHKNGDLVRNIKQPNCSYLDNVSVKRDNLPTVEVYDFYSDKLISKSKLSFEEPYIGTMTINKEAKDKRTVLLLSDSFGYALKSYLSDYFYKVVHVRGMVYSPTSLKSTFDKAKPDIVLLVNVERNLSL